MTPSADRADTQASRRSWPLWFWILAPVTLMMLIAFCVLGGQKLMQYQQEAAERNRKEAENEERERAKADDLKYGKEDDAKNFALNHLPSFMHFLDPPPIHHEKLSPETQTKLDRETGQWTVTGTYLEVEDDAMEADWVMIVN